jgi:hypothetical protein
MKGAKARLAEIELPDSGIPDAQPEIPRATYEARIHRLQTRWEERGLDRIVVHADREHSANLAYLSGLDPRFEEAIFLLRPTDQPAIVVGNECDGIAGTPFGPRSPPIGNASGRGATLWLRPWGSSCIKTSCRSRTSLPASRPSS